MIINKGAVLGVLVVLTYRFILASPNLILLKDCYQPFLLIPFKFCSDNLKVHPLNDGFAVGVVFSTTVFCAY